jgi:GTP-dependent phosphoenolpyruvate carboxykinase
MKKQTAVEWLVEQLEDDKTTIARVIGLKKYNSICKQALQMEKQEIIDAYHINPLETKWENIGKQYYAETYGK